MKEFEKEIVKDYIYGDNNHFKSLFNNVLKEMIWIIELKNINSIGGFGVWNGIIY